MADLADIRRRGALRLQAALPELGERLARKEVDILLCAVLDCAPQKLITEKTISDEHLAAFEGGLARRLTGEPLAYITGSREFYSLDFAVSPAVLIPRPETELLVERALRWVNEAPERRLPGLTIVDVGTGSGALLVAIAQQLYLQHPAAALERCRFIGLDIDANALAVAAPNAKRHAPKASISFAISDVLQALDPGATDGPLVIVSNPPYIAETERADLPRDVRDFEPAHALFAGTDGMRVIDRLIEQALSPEFHGPRRTGEFLLLIEIGSTQGKVLSERLDAYRGWRYQLLQDLRGLDRVVEVAAR